MDWTAEYIKSWARHGIYFGGSKVVLRQVSDDCLIYRFAYAYPVRERKGVHNDNFLNPEGLIKTIEDIPNRTIILLNIQHINRIERFPVSEFLDKLDHFLSSLPLQRRFALQLNNPEYLIPNYYHCLRQHDVAHVMNGDLLDRIVLTGDFGVVRVSTLASPETQLGIIEAVRRAVDEKKSLLVQAEDDTALIKVMELLNHDLAKLSRFKRQRAA